MHQSDPTNVDLHEGLAALCVDSGHADEAAACYCRCLELVSSARTPSQPVPDAARVDRWSVALFKCHASLCEWDGWNAEARALRSAVRRRQGLEVGGSVARPSPSCDDMYDPEGLLGLTLSPDERQHYVQLEMDAAAGTATPEVVGADGGDLSRPALHPFDSLSAPLSIGDCLAVAEKQSRGVLAEAKGGLGAWDGVAEGEGRRALLSRDARGRVRLGYVSGDLMATHPLTHLMQVGSATRCDGDRSSGGSRTMSTVENTACEKMGSRVLLLILLLSPDVLTPMCTDVHADVPAG